MSIHLNRDSTVKDFLAAINELLNSGQIRPHDMVRVDKNDGSFGTDRVRSIEMEDSADGEDRWRCLVIYLEGS